MTPRHRRAMRQERAVWGRGTPARKSSAEFGAHPVAVLDEESTADRISK
ncbi:hypothetical protein ACWGN9_09370 [Streptomyces sp. NPDC055775]